MARDHPGVSRWKVALGEMEEGAADPTQIHAQEYFPRPGPGVRRSSAGTAGGFAAFAYALIFVSFPGLA